MNKLLLAILFTLSTFQLSLAAGPVVLETSNKVAIAQFFAPDPSKSQVPASMTGTKVFKKSPTSAELTAGVIDWTDVIAMTVRPTATSTYYFNDDATKTVTLTANVINFIGISKNVSKVTLTLGVATAEVQGMTND